MSMANVRPEDRVPSLNEWLAMPEPYTKSNREKTMSEQANDYQVDGTHYLDMPIEPWAIIDTWPLAMRLGFYRGNALKYLMRMGRKGPLDIDAQKARHYLTKLLEVLEADRPETRA